MNPGLLLRGTPIRIPNHRSKPRNVYNDQELALFTLWYSNLLDMILAYTPPKLRVRTWNMDPFSRWYSYWKPSFLESMSVFGGVYNWWGVISLYIELQLGIPTVLQDLFPLRSSCTLQHSQEVRLVFRFKNCKRFVYIKNYIYYTYSNHDVYMIYVIWWFRISSDFLKPQRWRLWQSTYLCRTWEKARACAKYWIKLMVVESLATSYWRAWKVGKSKSKKSPTGPTERTPKPEYVIALATYLGVRW